MNVNTVLDFTGEVRNVGVGYKFDGFDNGEISVGPGDIVVFDDPDVHSGVGECEFISSSVSVGHVDCVYAVDDKQGYSVEIGVNFPCGRLPIDDRYTGIVTEDGVIGGINEDEARNMASRLLESDYSRWMTVKDHMGKAGVPEIEWERRRGSNTTGPGCEYCTDGSTEVTGV